MKTKLALALFAFLPAATAIPGTGWMRWEGSDPMTDAKGVIYLINSTTQLGDSAKLYVSCIDRTGSQVSDNTKVVLSPDSNVAVRVNDGPVINRPLRADASGQDIILEDTPKDLVGMKRLRIQFQAIDGQSYVDDFHVEGLPADKVASDCKSPA